jgi:hypothetical protein
MSSSASTFSPSGHAQKALARLEILPYYSLQTPEERNYQRYSDYRCSNNQEFGIVTSHRF